MKVAIIIVNYNKKELLQKCLLSLGQLDYPDFHTYVIDNGSDDGSADLLPGMGIGYTVIEMGYNAGFCKGNNVGIRQAIADGYEAIVLLNNDTIVSPAFLTNMVACIDHEKKIGMVSSKIILMQHPGLLDSAGLLITPDGLAKNQGFHHDPDTYNQPAEVFCPAGAAALYTRELLDDIKQEDMFFDEDFEYYFEELDLGWRARLRGWKCVYTPDAIVYHIKSATSGAYSAFVAFYTNRNIFYNIIKNYPAWFLWKALALSAARYLILMFGIFSRKGAGYKMNTSIGVMALVSVTIRGWKDVIIHLPKLLKRRAYIQRRKVKTNREITHWFKTMGTSFKDSVLN